MWQWTLLVGNFINVEKVRTGDMLRFEFLFGIALLTRQKEAGIQNNQL
jgi:hypothetical protein